MVSERDRRALDGIERRLAEQDPRFAASMTWVGRGARRGYDAVIVLGAATAALCFVLLLVCAAMVAALLVAMTLYLRSLLVPPGTGGRLLRRLQPDR